MTNHLPVFEMGLAALFAGFAVQPVCQQARVCGLTLDSRQVNPGDVFVALRGSSRDGVLFVDKAIQRGAVAVAVEANAADRLSDCPVPVVPVAGLREQLGAIADRFFGAPSKQLQVVGITGTNGKTSCCQYIAQSLAMAGIACGQIGTLGWGLPGELHETGNTTPDVVSLHRMLACFVAAGCQAAVMEVSSHALDQSRIDGIRFDTAVFTNLTRDHLDYHETMQAYGASKRKLFELPGLKQAVLNVDDNFGSRLYQELGASLPCVGFALEADADVRASSMRFTPAGIRACISSPWGDGLLNSSLLGRFNLSNLLAVFAVLCRLGLTVDKALSVIARLQTAPGRMEHYGGHHLPAVVVDYAHTPDALMVALAALRELCTGRLICVFGCGGERDPGKRTQMGRVAERLSDVVVLTNDNPRHENALAIIDDILLGMTQPNNVIVCADRAQAIHRAVGMAAEEDVVLVAGKGHETYQQTGNVRRAFKDSEQVKQALRARARQSFGGEA